MLFGAHMSTSGGSWMALQRGRSIHCQAVQIFVKNNMQWFGRPPSSPELARWKKEIANGPKLKVFGHTSYLINLGGAPSPNRDKSMQSLIQEIEFATALKLPFLVMHPGAHLGAGQEKGIERIVAGLDEVFRATRHSRVRIALEITAGQGSCLGHKLAHLASILDSVQTPSRLGICLDTAHLFAAGYDIRTKRGWDSTIKEVGKLIGLRQVLAFHLNDSKAELGSRVDRHAHIGQGKIGLEGFRNIVNDVRFKNHPACLETPKEKDLKEDVQNLAVLRSLVKDGAR